MQLTENQQEKCERLAKIRLQLGLTQAQMAKKVGISQPKLSAIEKKREGGNILNNIHHALKSQFNINPDWFETGKGEMFLESEVDPDSVRFMKVPGFFEFGKKKEPEPYPLSEKEDKIIIAMEKAQIAYEKALSATEKNVHLLEEISKLKDNIIEGKYGEPKKGHTDKPNAKLPEQ